MNRDMPNGQTAPMDPRDAMVSDRLGEQARQGFGLTYLFPYQRLVIGNVLDAATAPIQSDGDGGELTDGYHRRQIVILPTGAGKSLCFQLPATLLDGLTVVLFPLLSLIGDQERRLKERDLSCAVLTGSTDRAERLRLLTAIRNGEIRMLLSNPETILNPTIIEALGASVCSHLVIDEAHCVSEWGESFRPVYLKLGSLISSCNFRAVTAFTATASPLVLAKIRTYLFANEAVHYIQGNPDRENIRYHVVPTLCKEHALSMLLANGATDGDADDATDDDTDGDADGTDRTPINTESSVAQGTPEPATGDWLPRFRRPAIVFCRSRTGAEQTARLLRRRLGRGEIFFYHAGLERAEKQRLEQWFFASDDGILCSTCAYGMGVDKQNIRTVIHLDLSPSIESYLQESGRAGRDRKMADAILLTAPQDEAARARCKKELERQRFDDMLGYAQSPSGCRRTHLLALLGTTIEGCSGCDRCDGISIEDPPAKAAILQWAGRNSRRWTPGEAGQLLSAQPTLRARTQRLDRRHGWALLPHWHSDDIATAFAALVYRSLIVIPRRGFWRNRVCRALRKHTPQRCLT